jgi:hypothetical protein
MTFRRSRFAVPVSPLDQFAVAVSPPAVWYRCFKEQMEIWFQQLNPNQPIHPVIVLKKISHYLQINSTN